MGRDILGSDLRQVMGLMAVCPENMQTPLTDVTQPGITPSILTIELLANVLNVDGDVGEGSKYLLDQNP